MSHLSLRHASLVAVVALLALGARATAQTQEPGPQPCRGTPRPEQAERAFHLLSTAEPDAQRALASVGIVVQPATAPHGVLATTPACARLRAVLRKVIRPDDAPPEGLEDADLAFLELGDYYGVIVVTRTPSANRIRRAGAAPLYLFQKRTLHFVKRLAL